MNENQVEVAKPDEFKLMDAFDEKQIIEADKEVKQALVYINKTSNKQEITYAGLKHLVLEMSVAGYALEILESHVQLDKDDPNDKKTWIWRAKVRVRNIKTGYESEGLSEAPYHDQFKPGVYDPFGRIKATSKAERNAWRKQIPELKINALLKATSSDRKQVLRVDNGTPIDEELCRCKPIVCQNQPAKDGKCPVCKKSRLE